MKQSVLNEKGQAALQLRLDTQHYRKLASSNRFSMIPRIEVRQQDSLEVIYNKIMRSLEVK